MSNALDARRFLRGHRHGVLSTLSQKFPGYPFGSVAPFATAHDGCPVILVSALAEHTKNIAADPRVSLLVQQPNAGDVQASARLTLIGDASRSEDATLRARYLALFPAAADLLALGDFAFYRIAPKTVRFISGFGNIHWVDAAAFAAPANLLADIEADIRAHMNADHATALRDYCHHFHGLRAEQVALVAVDCDGFEVRADGHLLRIDFAAPVTDARSVREALVAMAREARS